MSTPVSSGPGSSPSNIAPVNDERADLYSRVKRRSALGTITNTVHSTPRRSRPPPAEHPAEGELSARTINTEREPGAFVTPRYPNRIPRHIGSALPSGGRALMNTVRRPLSNLEEHSHRPEHNHPTADRPSFQSPFALRANESIHVDPEFSQKTDDDISNRHELVRRLQIESTPESIPRLEPASPRNQQARTDNLSKESDDDKNDGDQPTAAALNSKKRAGARYKKPEDLEFSIPEEFLVRRSSRRTPPSTAVKTENVIAVADSDATTSHNEPPPKRRKSVSKQSTPAVGRKSKKVTAVKHEPMELRGVDDSHDIETDAAAPVTPAPRPTQSRKSARAKRQAESLSSLATPAQATTPFTETTQVKSFFTLPSEVLLFLTPIVLNPSVESTQAFTGPFTLPFIASLQRQGENVINEYLRVDPQILFQRVLIILKRDKVKQRAVARAVGLAPSTISPMLKGNYKHTKVGHLNKLRSWCIHRDVAFMTSVVQRAQIIGLDESGLTAMARIDSEQFKTYLLFTLDLEQRSAVDSNLAGWLKSTQSAMDKIVHASLERLLTQQYRQAVRDNLVPNARSKTLVRVSRSSTTVSGTDEEDEDADLPEEEDDVDDDDEAHSSSSSSSGETDSATSTDSEVEQKAARGKRHVRRSRTEQRRDSKRLRADSTTSPSVSSTSSRPSLNITVDSVDLNPEDDEANLSSSSVIGRRRPVPNTFVHTSSTSNIGARLMSPRDNTSPLRGRLSRVPPAPPSSSPYGGPGFSPRSQTKSFKNLLGIPNQGRLSFGADFSNVNRNTPLLQQFAMEAVSSSSSLNTSISSTSPSSLANTSISSDSSRDSVARFLDWGDGVTSSSMSLPPAHESTGSNDVRSPALPRKTHRRNVSLSSVPLFTSSQSATAFLSVPEWTNSSLPPMAPIVVRQNRKTM